MQKRYDLGNFCQMVHKMFKEILIANAEHPEKVPQLCEKGMEIMNKWRNRDDIPYNGASDATAKENPWP